MAKKPAKQPKKRKGASASTKSATDTQVLGSVTIEVQTQINVTEAGKFNEAVIEWGCLGLSEEPDSITEGSGNGRLLNPKRPPYTDEEGLHIFFDPELEAGVYGFLFYFTYNEAVEARTAEPKSDDQLAEENKKRAAAAAEE
jgi:hypothetical protein